MFIQDEDVSVLIDSMIQVLQVVCDFLEKAVNGGFEFFKDSEPLIVVLVEGRRDLSF